MVVELLALIVLPILEVLLWLIWLRVPVVGGFTALDREDAKLLALKELPVEIRALEELEGLEVLILELEDLEELEGLELLTLELEDLEELEGLELLTLELLLVEGRELLTLELLLVEGRELLTLELLLVEGREELTLELEDLEELEILEEPEDLEELEDLEGAELLETDRLPPLDLLDFFAVTGPASNIKAKVTVSRISQTFFECFKVYMAFLLTLLAYFNLILIRTKSTYIFLHHYKTQKLVKKRCFRGFLCNFMPLFHSLKASKICPVTLILRQNHPFFCILWELSGPF